MGTHTQHIYNSSLERSISCEKMNRLFVVSALVLLFVGGIAAQDCSQEDITTCVNRVVDCVTDAVNDGNNGNEATCDCIPEYFNCLNDENCVCDDGIEDIVRDYCQLIDDVNSCGGSSWQAECRDSLDNDDCDFDFSDIGDSDIPRLYFRYVRYVINIARSQFDSDEFLSELAARLGILVSRLSIRNIRELVDEENPKRQSEQTQADVSIESDSEEEADRTEGIADSVENDPLPSFDVASSNDINESSFLSSAAALGVSAALVAGTAVVAALL